MFLLLLLPLGSSSVVIEETCAKPFFILIGLVMFFNSMNLDLTNGCAILGQDFKVFSIRIFAHPVCVRIRYFHLHPCLLR